MPFRRAWLQSRVDSPVRFAISLHCSRGAHRREPKGLVRWRRDGNHSVGGRFRQLARFHDLIDQQALAMPLPLDVGQEIIAYEAGHTSWAGLKHAVSEMQEPLARSETRTPLKLKAAIPVLFRRDVGASAQFYRDQLGFVIDFLHGHPPFYGAVMREGAILHLKFVHEPVFASGRVEREELIMAFVSVDNIKALFAEYAAKNVSITQSLTKQAWGGTDIHVRDLDGNRIAFVS